MLADVNAFAGLAVVLSAFICTDATTHRTTTAKSNIRSSKNTTTRFNNHVYKGNNSELLSTLLEQLDDTSQCDRVVALSSLHALLGRELNARYSQLLLLARLIAQHPHLHPLQLPSNATLTAEPILRLNSSAPLYTLQLICEPNSEPVWIPTLLYPTVSPTSFLTLRLPPFDLDACAFSECQREKCTWTVHGGTRVHARTCCSNATALCRDRAEQGRGILVLFNAVCALLCVLLIPLVFRERRRHREARGWALMELFLLGAATLYSILLLEWLSPPWPTCCLAVWLRQIGFSTFYGAVVLKIYRNLQEYRVRKAHHVFVKEEDLLKYLLCMLALTTTGLTAWTLGSWSDTALWKGAWPQCAAQPWSLTWHGYELLFLLYGMRLCYKARNSNWLERWQFTVAVCLEAVITLMANLIRYSIRNSGHSDTLMTVTFVQLHLTISVNIVIIIAPKFYFVSSESTRRTQTLSGSSARAHPSLAKLRDNLLNGTIDFAEVPIVDMNPEDIRAELKRVYTQLRMYKLKNIYQDNPHISKRKGGKKSSDKVVRNRRISIPPSSSPKVRRVEEEERSDLTVESAPHNVFLSTYKLQLEPHQSVRV
uniref:G-protein coupled receptors family 3 profile domain-containing protein n=1 Tax=Parascaris univalens TaxID=6257 RepID=A0A915AAT9_PARUN